jgi:hypothetical protein
MATAIIGFADSGKWARVGNEVYRVPTDKSYREHLLGGLPIESILAIEDSTINTSCKVFEVSSESTKCEDCDKDDDYICSEYTEDELSDYVSSPGRNHHKKPRSRTARKSKPIHEPKAQKNKLNRGKVRVVSDTPEMAEWDNFVHDMVSEHWWTLSCTYRRRDVESIFRRFNMLISQKTHPTADHIEREWKKFETEVLTSLEFPRYYEVRIPAADNDYLEDRDFHVYM